MRAASCVARQQILVKTGRGRPFVELNRLLPPVEMVNGSERPEGKNDPAPGKKHIEQLLVAVTQKSA